MFEIYSNRKSKFEKQLHEGVSCALPKYCINSYLLEGNIYIESFNVSILWYLPRGTPNKYKHVSRRTYARII